MRARRRAILCAFVWLIGETTAGALAAQEETAAADREQARVVAFRGSVEWIGAVRWLDPADTPINDGNRRLGIPQLALHAEVRPNLRVELGSRLTAVARPRGVATAQSAWIRGGARTDTGDLSANWTELYVNWRPVDPVQVTYGLQNFGWGPAELLAPSNRIFHETGLFRDPLYYVRGRHLLRVNLSAGRNWSAVALAELRGNGEEPFVAREPFRRQGQAKIEYSAPTGRAYVGATIGGREGSPPWFGEYFSFALTEGLSVYADATHSNGSAVWYPVLRADGTAAFERAARRQGVQTLGVAGLRYTFAAGPDARAEYVHQDAGYSAEQFAHAALAAALAISAEDLRPYFAPGLEFLGRRLVLLSLRVPQLPPRRHLMVHGRYLHSVTDRSGVGFLTASLEAAGALVLFGSATASHGGQTAEFSRLARASALAGAVWTW